MMHIDVSEEATLAIEAAYATPRPPAPPPTDADWQRLRTTLERVRPRWRPEPMSEVAVASFEARHGIRLPAEFRRLVRTLGDCARSLHQWHPWDDGLTRPWAEHVREYDAPMWHGCIRGGALGLDSPNEWGIHVLAVSGPQPGTIWLAKTRREHLQPTGLGFFAWYEAELAPALARVEAADAAAEATMRALEQRAADDPASGEPQLQLAREWALRGDTERAADALARARALGRDLDREATVELILAATTEPNPAIRAARLHVLLHAGFTVPSLSAPVLRMDLGVQLAAIGRDEEVIEILTPLLHHDSPTHRDRARPELASALLRRGRPAEALALLDPRPRVGQLACECLLALGRRAEAQAAFAAGSVDGERRGYLQFKLGALAQAQASLEQRVARYSWFVEPRHLYELALVQAHRGALATAEQTLTRALEAGFPIAEVVADDDALPLHTSETFRCWSAPDPPAI